ncbi:MAG: hypothetical protein A2Z50_02905 [Nitrospirae bacterium RBG_19FT_COMBO_42_15]|nr:MAG: hypothetical protein A2Z50_02905 [Nitrospirae bacterium RBG_19FT_COMBO_42_15]
MQQNLDLYLGAVFVIINAYDRFNTPCTNRASTTAARYHITAAIYSFIYLLIYYILSKYQYLLGAIGISGASDIISDAKNTLQGQPHLLAALLLTVLLPKIPMLSSIDNWLRKQLNEHAAIPHEARRLSRELHNTEFNVPQDVRNKIQEALVDDGFEPTDIVFDKSNQPQHLWTKIAVLVAHMESKWESDSKFTGYFNAEPYSSNYKQLKDKYKHLSDKAKKCFRLHQEIPIEGEDQKIRNAIKECTANFKEQGRDLFKGLCDFISQGVLKCQLTRTTRWDALNAIGFETPNTDDGREKLTIDQVLMLFCILIIVLILNITLFGSHSGEYARKIFLYSKIATLHTIAVVCVVYLKNKWKFTLRNTHDTRPMLFYLTAGIAAVILAIPINLMFNFIFYITDSEHVVTAFEKAWIGLSTRYPYMLLTFITAFGTAINIDNRPFWKITYSVLRWIEGVIQALFNLSAAYIVYLLLNDPTRDLNRLLLTGALIGFIIGFVVPHWYRTAPLRQKTIMAASGDEAKDFAI